MAEKEFIKVLVEYASSVGMPLNRIEALLRSLRPELDPKALISKATEYARGAGVAPHRLTNPVLEPADLIVFEGQERGKGVVVFSNLHGDSMMMSHSPE